MDIKEIRVLTGMSQKKFSEYFSIPVRTLQDWEAGKRTPPTYVLELIDYKLKKERIAMTNKNRFDSEKQHEIARESVDKAYEEKYGISGIEDMGYEEYENLIDMIFVNSDESAFHGTDDEIADMWFDKNMFE